MNVYPQAGPSNQDILLGEIRNLLTIVTHTLLLNPTDEASRTQLSALNQLQTILQSSALPYEQIEQVRKQLSSLAIHEQAQQTTTPPVPELGQVPEAEALLESLRAAGLLGVTPVPVVQPIVTPNTMNLRNSDLEMTSVSLQKYILHLFSNQITSISY
jgi:type II secretory pathway component PulM